MNKIITVLSFGLVLAQLPATAAAGSIAKPTEPAKAAPEAAPILSGAPGRPSLDKAFDAAVELPSAGSRSGSESALLPYTTDTQIRLLGLFEPATNNDPTPPVGEADSSYLMIDAVPLRHLIRLLARRSGIDYLEPAEDAPLDGAISLEMKKPEPRALLDSMLKHRGLELYDAGTGLYTIRKYTNQLSFFKFKLHDNFMDRFKGSAQGTGAGGGSGAGNAVSANAGAIQVENGGKYGEIEGLMEKVANSGEDKNNKVWYYDEKQYALLYGTRSAADRLVHYLEIANQRNPNVQIQVRIFGTSANPASSMGVDWSSMMSPGLTFGVLPGGASQNSTFSTNGTGSGLKSLSQLGSAFGQPMSTLVLQNNLSATLNFFVNEAKAESLSQPSAITANGREVAFAATQQIPYVSGSSTAAGYTGTTGVGYDNTSFVNVGTTINILPRIQDGLRIKLGTALSISQLDQFVTISSGTQGSPPRQVPQTSGRAFSGEFTLNSGETVVVAGLKQSTLSKNRNKIPFLGDIPGLGTLFRSENDKKDTAYLTIFITATIMDEENHPALPEQRLTREDSQPDDESTLSAEPNMRHWTSKAEWQDRAVVNAKKQALETSTIEANRRIAERLQKQDEVHELTMQFEKLNVEIRALEAGRNRNRSHPQAPDEDNGNIEGVKPDVEVRLIKARVEREQAAQKLGASKASLDQAQHQEETAKRAVEKADEDYAKELQSSFPVEPEKIDPASVSGANSRVIGVQPAKAAVSAEQSRSGGDTQGHEPAEPRENTILLKRLQ